MKREPGAHAYSFTFKRRSLAANSSFGRKTQKPLTRSPTPKNHSRSITEQHFHGARVTSETTFLGNYRKPDCKDRRSRDSLLGATKRTKSSDTRANLARTAG